MNTPTTLLPGEPGIHQTLLESAVPKWLTTAPAALREAYFSSSSSSLYSSTQARTLLAAVQTAEVFCTPLLQAALDREYPTLGLHATGHELIRKVRDSDALISRLMPRQQTLLEAALQNFLPDEAKAGGIEKGSVIAPVGAYTFAINDDGTLQYRLAKTAVIDLAPETFAAFCRRLDLGKQYQQHLNEVLKPLAAGSLSRDEAQASTAATLMFNLRDGLDVEAVVARIKGNVLEPAYRMLLQITRPQQINQPVQWSGETVRYCQLGLLHTPLKSGHALLGPVLIEPVTGKGPCLVYLPGDPDIPLKQYDSLQHFAQVLREKLRSRAYRNDFARFIGQASRARFLQRLDDTLEPEPVTWPGQAPRQRQPDPDADIGVRAFPVAGTLTRLMYDQLLIRLCENARAIAVPSEDEDRVAREQRIALWLERGMSALGIAAFAVPGLGELMAVVGAGQLIRDICIGVDDWKHGQTVEALAHLASVAQNLAMIGAGIVAGVAIARSPFVEGLVPVPASNGSAAAKLIHPDLAPYALDLTLPEDLATNDLGQYTLNGQTYVRMDGKLYRQVYDAQRQCWTLDHPRLAEHYRPAMSHNGAGAWQHLHEDPLQWQGAALLRRLGAASEGLSDAQFLTARQAVGIGEDQLRAVHVNQRPMPAALEEACVRLRTAADVRGWVTRLRGEQAVGQGADACVALLPDMPGWPAQLGVRLTELDGRVVDLGGGDAGWVSLSRTQWREGQWAKRVVSQLTPQQKADMFADSVANTQEGQSAALAQRLAEHVEENSDTLTAQLYNRQQPSLSAGGKVLQRDFPGLPRRLANQIGEAATDVERKALLDTGKVPARLAEEARLHIAELRLSKAMEALARVDGMAADRDTLAMGLLDKLPGWSGDVRIELRAGSTRGKTLASAGPSTASQLKYVIRHERGYQPMDGDGQTLSGDTDLYQALCAALPDSERSALALQTTDAEKLRRQLAELAAADRSGAGALLGQRRVQPWFKSPLLPGGGHGYPLSGRGDASWGQRRRLRKLFPGMSSADMLALRESIVRPGDDYEIAVKRLEQEYEVLSKTLSEWQAKTRIGGSRKSVCELLISAWRRESNVLDLSGRDITELPVLTAQFPAVTELKMGWMGLTADPSLFLSRFPKVETLSLAGNLLSAVPEQIAALTELRSLNLSSNRLAVTETMFDALASDPATCRLATLDLHQSLAVTRVDNVDQANRLTARTVAALGRMGKLRKLALSGNALQLDDGALQVISGIDSLQSLMLQENFIELSSVGRSAFKRLHGLQALNLSYNSLGLAPDVTGMASLRYLGLYSAGIEQWPPGLSGLMNQAIVNLERINLGSNDIVDIPAIADFRFTRLTQAVFRDGRMRLILDLNPLSDASRNELRLAGMGFRPIAPAAVAGAAEAWLSGAPAELKTSIAADRTSSGAQGFYRVMDQVGRTAAYQADAQAYKERMWKIMRAILPEPGSVEGDGLGVVDLRQQLFDLASLVDNTCGDGIALVIDQLETQVLAWQAASSAAEGGAAMFQPLLRLSRQLYRTALVDDCAVSITQARLARLTAISEGQRLPTLSPLDELDDAQLRASSIDEVEMRLMLRERLQQTLGLLPQPLRIYEAIVSGATVKRVSAQVLATATAANEMSWLVDQSYWVLYLQKVFDMQFKALNAAWDDAMLLFDEATDPLEPFSLSGSRLTEAQAKLQALDPATQWEGVPRKITLDSLGKVQTYKLIMKGREDAQQALVLKLSNEQVAAAPR